LTKLSSILAWNTSTGIVWHRSSSILADTRQAIGPCPSHIANAVLIHIQLAMNTSLASSVKACEYLCSCDIRGADGRIYLNISFFSARFRTTRSLNHSKKASTMN
uniref:Secreted protein n=1 Tax=Haemonchus placei TaxID=6290 RepID=A0A158QPK1_HAEPC